MTTVPSRAWGLLIIGAVLYWMCIALTMHIVEPEFSPLRAPMSAYGRGTYGVWMTTTFPVLCVALVSAGLGLTALLPATRQTRAALLVFLVAAGGALLAGIFPMDFPGPPRTTSGRLHALGGALAFPAWVLGTFFSPGASAINVGEGVLPH